MSRGRATAGAAGAAPQIPEDMRLQDLTWKFQRVAWLVSCGVLLAGVWGVFGDGLALHVRQPTVGGFVVYDAFARRRTPTVVEITHVASSDLQDSILLSPTLAADLDIARTVPTPASVESGDEGVVFRWVSQAPAAQRRVLFELSRAAAGPHVGWVTINGHDRVAVDQFVHP